MTQVSAAPEPLTTTTTRFELVLPLFTDRLDVRPLNAAFEKLDAEAAGLPFSNTFTAPQTIVGDLNIQSSAGTNTLRLQASSGTLYATDIQATNISASGTLSVANLSVPGTISAGGNISAGGSISATGSLTGNYIISSTNLDVQGGVIYFRGNSGYSLNHDGTWFQSSHSVLTHGDRYAFVANGGIFVNWDGIGINHSHQIRGPSIYVSSTMETAAGLVVGGNIHANAGMIYFEPSLQVYIHWRGDLAALYMPYGGGIYLHAGSADNFTVRGTLTCAEGRFSGQVHCTHLNTSADVQGVAPVYVAGQNGDGFLRWYPKALFSNSSVWRGQISGQMDGANSDTFTAVETGWYVVAVRNVNFGNQPNSFSGVIEMHVAGGLVSWTPWGVGGGSSPNHGQPAAVWEGMVYATQTITSRMYAHGAVGIHPWEFSGWGNFYVWYLGPNAM